MHRALIVCNSMYEADPAAFTELRGPRADGVHLVRALTDPETGLFAEDGVQSLFEFPASKILHEAEKFYGGAGPDDVALFYYSGHGYRQDGQLFLCARDTKAKYMESTAVPDSALNRVLNRSRARAKILILDCCYSGAFKGPPDAERLAGRGRYILAATSPVHQAKDAEDGQQLSTYTRWLIDALRRGADDRDGDGLVDLDDLHSYLDAIAEDGPRPFRIWTGSGVIPIARRRLARELRDEPATPAAAAAAAATEPEVVPFLDRLTALTSYHPDRLSAFRRDMKQDAELGLPERLSATDFLHAALLMRDGRLTMAGALLFGERPAAVFPAAVIQCTHIRGRDKNGLIDSRTLRGTLPEQIVKAQEFVARLATRGEEPVEGAARSRTVFAYPMITVREVVANAVVHRDYEQHEQCVHVRVFTDRVEVSSPGAWVGRGLGPGELRRIGELTSESRRRNFRLADVLGWMKLVEGEGAGLHRAVHECREDGFREPTVSEADGMVTVTIYPRDDEPGATPAARTVFAGDVVHGDKLVSVATARYTDRVFAAGPVRPVTVAGAERERVRDTFVPPPGWPEWVEPFRSTRTLVMTANPGVGATTAALALLMAVGAGELVRIDAPAGLGALADWLRHGPAGTGYLLDGLAPGEVIDEAVLGAIAAALTSAGSWLLIVAGEDVSGIEAAPFTVHLAVPAPLPEVFRAHLGAAATEEGVQWATEHLASVTNVRDAVALAEIIDRATEPGGEFDRDEAARRWESRAESEVQSWFADLADADLRTLAIAIAVLGGLPYDRVSAAAVALFRRVDGSARAAGVPAFSSPRGRRLQDVRAHLEVSVVRTRYGRAPVELVSFDDPSVAPKVIRHVWREYDVIRVPLLEWLTDLARDESEPVRVFAATALGMIATQSFEFVVDAVAVPWATGTDRRLREAVVTAFRLAILDNAVGGRIPAVIAGWRADRNSPEARATAALAYGAGLGATDLGGALSALGGLTEDAPEVVADAVGAAMAQLAKDGGRDALDVIDALARWSSGRSRSAGSELAFTVLAATTATVAADQDEDVVWPLLLLLTRDLPEARSVVAGLWARTLDSPLTFERMRGVLRDWAVLAEKQAGVEEAFLRFLRLVAATSPRVGSLVRGSVTAWSRDSAVEMSPALAERMAAVIDES
ncbi:caspase, EACC1-associated type [Actinoplanes sp. CA-030573]|uniref:caspase, EACC1-associated type n=1 Tax=Actinoplanes sp. CA-030573 TaxID=3239898 RepID=UPI003D8AF97E